MACAGVLNSRLSVGQSYRTLHQTAISFCGSDWTEEYLVIEIGSYRSNRGGFLQRYPIQ